MSGLTALEEAARQRLSAYYNGGAYNPSTNPGGLAAGGHQANFEPSLEDVALVGQGLARMALEAGASAAQTAADLTSILALAGQTFGINTSPTGVPRIALLGACAFVDQAPVLVVPIETAGALVLSPHQTGAIVFSNADAITLPAFAACRTGWWCEVKNIHGVTSANVSVVAGDTIDGGAGPLALAAGTSRRIFRAAAGWRSI